MNYKKNYNSLKQSLLSKKYYLTRPDWVEKERKRCRKKDKKRWRADEEYRQKKIKYAKDRREKLKLKNIDAYRERTKKYKEREKLSLHFDPERKKRRQKKAIEIAIDWAKRNKDRVKQLRIYRQQKMKKDPIKMEIYRAKQAEMYKKRQFKKGKIVKQRKRKITKTEDFIKNKTIKELIPKLKIISKMKKTSKASEDDIFSHLLFECNRIYSLGHKLSLNILNLKAIEFVRKFHSRQPQKYRADTIDFLKKQEDNQIQEFIGEEDCGFENIDYKLQINKIRKKISKMGILDRYIYYSFFGKEDSIDKISENLECSRVCIHIRLNKIKKCLIAAD